MIAAQINTIRPNYIKPQIDNTQKNSECRLCIDKDEKINGVVNEGWKLAPKKECKIRHDWVGEGIHMKLYKNLNFDYSAKWYVHKVESSLENETYKIIEYWLLHQRMLWWSGVKYWIDPFIMALEQL